MKQANKSRELSRYSGRLYLDTELKLYCIIGYIQSDKNIEKKRKKSLDNKVNIKIN